MKRNGIHCFHYFRGNDFCIVVSWAGNSLSLGDVDVSDEPAASSFNVEKYRFRNFSIYRYNYVAMNLTTRRSKERGPIRANGRNKKTKYASERANFSTNVTSYPAWDPLHWVS